MTEPIPRAQSQLSNSAGIPTREWYTFFLSLLRSAEGNPALEAQIQSILIRLEALENDSSFDFQLIGLDSVIVVGTPQNGFVQINLDGDTGEPGGTYFYGTRPDGAKGWQLLGDAFVAETGELTKEVEPDTGVITLGLADVPDSGTGTLQAITVDAKGRVTGAKDATITGTAGQIAVANGNASSGLPTISLVDVPDAGGGTLQKTKFDAKGRKIGTSSATTDDLPEGSANLYFPEAPIDGKQYARKDAAWSEVDAISIQFPFYATSGAFDPVPLTANRELPFFLSSGTQANIPMVAA